MNEIDVLPRHENKGRNTEEHPVWNDIGNEKSNKLNKILYGKPHQSNGSC